MLCSCRKVFKHFHLRKALMHIPFFCLPNCWLCFSCSLGIQSKVCERCVEVIFNGTFSRAIKTQLTKARFDSHTLCLQETRWTRLSTDLRDDLRRFLFFFLSLSPSFLLFSPFRHSSTVSNQTTPSGKEPESIFLKRKAPQKRKLWRRLDEHT